MAFEIVVYERENGSIPFMEFLESLLPKMKAKILRDLDLLEDKGNTLREPYSKHLEDGIFELRCKLPEGYAASEVDTGTDSGIVLMSVASEDPEKPTMLLSVAFDELLSEVDRLNDLDAEALSKIEATFQADDQVKISYCETAQGTKLMMVREAFENMDFVDFYTIYKGYQLEFVLVGGGQGKEPITEEQVQTALNFLSDLEFVDLQGTQEAT